MGLLLLRTLHRRRNQTYVVLSKGSDVLFYAFERSMLTNKKQKGPFKALDLKTVFSDFCGQNLICELILALVYFGY